MARGLKKGQKVAFHTKGVEGSVSYKDSEKVVNAIAEKNHEKLVELKNNGVLISDDVMASTLPEKQTSLVNNVYDYFNGSFNNIMLETTAKDKLGLLGKAFDGALKTTEQQTAQEQLNLENIILCANDPVVFARTLGFEPDEWQAKLLRSKRQDKLLSITRQGGKSTITALLAVHSLIYKPGLILVLSPGYRQSKLLLEKVKTFYNLAKYKPAALVDNVYSMEFANGSQIHALPNEKDKIRGFSDVKLIIIDEAAFVSQELYNAVSPMRAVSNGDMIAMSTPNGKQGWFYKALTEETSWEKYLITADDCPRITKEFLDAEKLRLPQTTFLQEYYCIPMEVEGAVFDSESIEKSFVDSEEVLHVNY